MANTGKTIKLAEEDIVIPQTGKTKKLRYRPVLTKEDRTRINKTNKRRATEMERRIARYLRGKRTPMSGAGTIKGDVLVHTDRGLCVVSCKLSSMLTENGSAYIPFIYKWFNELYNDVNALASLGAKFGILVIHWHGFRDDLVFIPIQYLPIITTTPMLHLPEYDMRYALNGKEIKSTRMYRDLIVSRVNHLWKMGNTTAVLLPLERVRELLSDENDSTVSV